jgi:hypothetical protein
MSERNERNQHREEPDRRQVSKRAYRTPTLTDLGPVVNATLGPTPDFGESGPGGVNFRVR